MHDPELLNCKKVLLKGQAVAQYYPHPELRMSGDIDLWCVRDGMTLGESLEAMVRQVFARIPDAGVQPHHTDWTDVDGVVWSCISLHPRCTVFFITLVCNAILRRLWHGAKTADCRLMLMWCSN